jgi:hypothetical protein
MSHDWELLVCMESQYRESIAIRIFLSKFILKIWPEQCGWEWWGYFQYMPYLASWRHRRCSTLKAGIYPNGGWWQSKWGPVACSVWNWIHLILGVNGGECMVEGSNHGLFGGQLWCNNHPQNQQSQPNPRQTIEATRLVLDYISPVLSVCKRWLGEMIVGWLHDWIILNAWFTAVVVTWPRK